MSFLILPEDDRQSPTGLFLYGFYFVRGFGHFRTHSEQRLRSISIESIVSSINWKSSFSKAIVWQHVDRSARSPLLIVQARLNSVLSTGHRVGGLIRSGLSHWEPIFRSSGRPIVHLSIYCVIDSNAVQLVPSNPTLLVCRVLTVIDILIGPGRPWPVVRDLLIRLFISIVDFQWNPTVFSVIFHSLFYHMYYHCLSYSQLFYCHGSVVNIGQIMGRGLIL